MTQKLDLSGLLQKYEGLSTNGYNGYSSRYNDGNRGFDYAWQRNRVNDDFFPPHSATAVGTFRMSKSECEQFLLRVRNELRNEERAMQSFVEDAFKQIHEKFKAHHEAIRREVMELLDSAFRDSERLIADELRSHSNGDPNNFAAVHQRIADIDDEISRLLNGLKGSDYRRSIAETVMRDFSEELLGLREGVRAAEESFLSGLGEAQLDHARANCLREDAQRLFKVTKRTVIFDPLRPTKDVQPPYQPRTESAQK
jgi:hypothetical protein